MTSTEHTDTSLLAWQEALEDHCIDLGKERYRNQTERARGSGRGSSVRSAWTLVSEGVGKVHAGLQALIDQPRKRGAEHKALQYVRDVGAERAAFIALRVAFDTISGQPDKHTSKHSVAVAVADGLLDELRFRTFKKVEPMLFEYTFDNFMKGASAYERARAMRKQMKRVSIDVSHLHLPPAEKDIIGSKILDVMIETTGLFQVETRRNPHANKQRRGHKFTFFAPTQETLQWLARRDTRLEALHPVTQPMVVPPLDWSKDEAGGFRYTLRGKADFIRKMRHPFSHYVEGANCDVVYGAVNALQRTAWKINPHVLAVVEEIVSRGAEHRMAGLPAFHEISEIPNWSPTPNDPKSSMAWGQEMAQLKSQEHGRLCEAIDVNRTLGVAQRFAEAPALYFVWTADFRGRLYPVSTKLHPQGPDLHRALLTFSEGKPLDDQGAFWLAVHLANCIGGGVKVNGKKLDKLALAARAQWVIEHTAMLAETAEDPFAHNWWMDVDIDAPLQAYAAMVEWGNYARARNAGKEYVCSLPVTVDGSCNGLQHLGAAMRCPIVGQQVNLIPSEEPADIYADTAVRVTAALQRRVDDGSDDTGVCAAWLSSGLVTRSLCKPATMTLPYGSTSFGRQAQIEKQFDELEVSNPAAYRRVREHFSGYSPEGKKMGRMSLAAAVMADALTEALEAGGTASAVSLMKWYQKSAERIVRGTNLPVRWTVPGTGFVVVQPYLVPKLVQVRTVMMGKLYRTAVYEPTKKIDVKKQMSGVAPNITHSLDAAVMQLTVVAAENEGVMQMTAVHDCYGCLPADMPLLSQVLRRVFYDFYTRNDILAHFTEQFQMQMKEGDTVPDAPERGTLDPAGVLASTYFFS